MTQLKVIYDGNIPQGDGVVSERFQNVRAILWDTGNSNNNTFTIIGLSLTVFVPVIGTVLEKEIILPLEDAVNVGDEKYVLWIPFELGDLPYEMELTMATSLPDVYARFYVLISEASLESNSEKLSQIIEQLTIIGDRQVIDLAQDIAVVSNQLAQNAALGLLAGSLAPITAGTSLAVEAPLIQGSSVLAPLLLPGF